MPGLLLDRDMIVIDHDFAVLLLGDQHDGIDDDSIKLLLHGFDRFAGHRGIRDLEEDIPVIGIDGDREIADNLQGFLHPHPVSLCDHGGMDLLCDEMFCLLHQRSHENDSGGSPVPDLVILGPGDLDHHLGARVLDGDVGKDGGTVIGDCDIPRS